MADAPSPTKTKNVAIRPWLRAIHRDTGYLAVGLTFVYALSGLAVNHIADWDPNFQNYETAREIGAVDVALSDDAAAVVVRERLAITETQREVYRNGPSDLDLLFERRTVHANLATGHVIDEGQKPRFFLRVANWLHLTRGKRAWTWAADAYAAALLFLAVSGMFMLPGRRGLLGRGAVFVLIGIAIPTVYIVLSPR